MIAGGDENLMRLFMTYPFLEILFRGARLAEANLIEIEDHVRRKAKMEAESKLKR